MVITKQSLCKYTAIFRKTAFHSGYIFRNVCNTNHDKWFLKCSISLFDAANDVILLSASPTSHSFMSSSIPGVLLNKE